MANNRKVNYQIGFTADTSSLQQALNQAMQSLQKLGTQPNLQLTSQLKEASSAALDLSNHLRTAFNQETGKLDLITFNDNLKRSGLSLEQYANKLISIGPAGERAFMDVAQAIAKADLPLKRSSDLLNNLWITMKNTMKWQLTSSALHGFTGAISTAYGYAKDLNSSLNSIQIVTDKNNESMAKFAENANKAAKALSTTTIDYTDASLIYYQQGLSDEEVEGRTATTIKLANVAGETAERASEQLTAIWNNFYDGSKSLEYYADVMTALGAATASSTQEISAGVQKFAAVADTVGLSYEYATSALATITATTRESAEVVGNSLKTLFARIEGLLQDGEADDGTSLNKYSEALANVGINIKDTSGQMKSMNQILDEMGAKWGTLSQAQQLALAQTVAGVRQYTQLIALMENWEFFQENLTTAMNAEGTLEKQAKIYADSWEAARDRVRAAAEDIYDSLINDDFYIGLDNFFTPVLTGIADIVDAVGGMKGVLATASLLINKLYGDKIAQSMRDMATNLGIISGKEGERARALQSSASALVDELTITLSANEAEQVKLNILKQEIETQGIINQQYDSLNDYQKKIVQDEQYKLSIIKQQAEAIADQMSELQKLSSVKEDAIQNAIGKKGWQDRINKEIDSWNSKHPTNKTPEMRFSKDIVVDKDIDKTFNNITKQLDSLIDKKAGLQQISDQFTRMKTAGTNTTAAMKELIASYDAAMDTSNMKDEQLESTLNNLSDEAIEAGQQIRELGTFLKLMGADAKVVDSWIAELQQLAMKEKDSEAAQELYNQKVKEFQDLISEGIPTGRDWADTLVLVGSGLAKVTVGIQAIQSLGRVFSDEDMSASQRFITLLTAMSTIIPLVVQGMKLLNIATKVSITTEGESTVVRTSGIAATLAKRVADAALARGESEVAASAAAANAALLLQIAIIAAIVVAIGAIVYAVSNLAITEEDARESIQETTEAYEEEKQKLESLNSTLETTRQRIEELEGKGPLTIVEQEELKKLKEQELSLQRQVALQERLTKAKQKENAKNIKENFVKSIESLAKGPDLTRNMAVKADIWWANQQQELKKLGFNEGSEEWDKDYQEYLSRQSKEMWSNTEFIDADTWFNSVTQGLSKTSEAYQEFQRQYDEWVQYNNEKREKFLADNAEGYQQGVQNYLDYIEAIESGAEKRDEATIREFKQGYQSMLHQLYSSDAEYEEFVLRPVLDEPALEDIEEQLYNELLNGDAKDAKYLINDDVRMALDKAGLFEDEFLDYLNEKVDTLQKQASDFKVELSNFTVEDWKKTFGFSPESIKDADALLAALKGSAEQVGEIAEIAKENYVEISKIVNKLKTGDTISPEDYEKLGRLGEQNFIETLDGDYKLIGLAEELQKRVQDFLVLDKRQKDMLPLRLENDRLEKIKNYNINDLLGTSYYYIEKEYNQIDHKYNHENLQQQLDIIEVLGDQSKEIQDKVSKWQEQLKNRGIFYQSELQEIADLVAECADSFDTLHDKIENNNAAIEEMYLTIAYSYDNLEDLREAYRLGLIDLQAFTTVAAYLNEELDTQDLNEDEWKNFSKYLKNAAREIDNLYDHMDDDTADMVAKSIMKMNNGLEALSKNIDNWAILENPDNQAMATEEYATALYDCKDAVADLLDINSDFVSDDFITDNFNKIKEVANGSTEAIDDLKKELAKQLIVDIGIENDSYLSEETLLNRIQILQNSMPDLEVGAKLDDGPFLSQLKYLIYQTGMTVEQVNALCDSLGFDVKYKKMIVPYEYQVPVYEESTKAEDYDNEGKPSRMVHAVANKTYETVSGSYTTIAMSTNGKTPIIEEMTAKPNSSFASPPKSSGSGGGGSSKKQHYTNEEDKKLKDVEERYHKITRAINNQSNSLDKLGKNIDRTYGADKLKNYEKELKALEKQQENYNTKLQEAQDWLPKDAAELKRLFGEEVEINPITGELENYRKLLEITVDEYNKDFLAGYNEFMKKYTEADNKDSLEDEKQKWDERKEAADKEFEERQKAITQYEQTLDVIQDTTNALEENARAMADNKLSQIEYKLEIVLDVKDLEKQLRDLEKNIAETFGDALTHGVKIADIGMDQAKADMDLLPEYTKQFNELKAAYESADKTWDRQRIIDDIKNLQGNIIDTAEELVEWWNSIEDIIPDMLDAAADRFKLFTDQLDHNTSVADAIKELYTLQGVSYKTADGFNKLQKVSQEKLEAQVAQARIERDRYETLKVYLAQAQADLDALNGDESDPRYDILKKARDAYLEQMNEAGDAQLTLGKAAMETARDMFTDELNKTIYEFGQVLSNGLGLDLLQDKYDHYIETNERYFDKVNEAYQTTSWYNKLQQDIDKTNNSATAERLKALQEEINIRRENNKLSQYDLDILNAKYEVLQAQMALEDAQNAKNNLQLVRDSQGNWNYQYSANPEDVENAEQNLLDAQNEYYNIAKDRVNEVTGEIISTWKECQEKLQEIYEQMADGTLTYEEGEARKAEITKFYTDKIKDLEEEKQIAIADMTQAGNESLFTAAVIMGDDLTDLTSITSKDIQKIVENGGSSVIGLLTKDNETIKNIIGSNTNLIDLFDNTYAKDLNNMTKNSDKFEELLNKTLDKAESDYNDFRDTINEVAEETGTTQEELAERINEVSEATDELTERARDASEAIWAMADEANAAVDKYKDMADAIWEAVRASQALAKETTNEVKKSVTTTTDDSTDRPDYSKLMVKEFLSSGGTISDEVLALGQKRDAAIQSENIKDVASTQTILALMKAASDGSKAALGYLQNTAFFGKGTEESIKEFLKKNGYATFDTGGYTGEFGDAKLAFLHQKELVLNQDDTRNILSAVNMVRDMGSIFSTIEKMLDGGAMAAMSLMADKLSGLTVNPSPTQLEQTIHIDEVKFEGATTADEIKEAFRTIANDAAQWASRRKE